MTAISHEQYVTLQAAIRDCGYSNAAYHRLKSGYAYMDCHPHQQNSFHYGVQ